MMLGFVYVCDVFGVFANTFSPQQVLIILHSFTSFLSSFVKL